MAESLVVKNRRSGLLEIIVGAFSYTVKWQEGNFQVNIPGISVAQYLNRGRMADSLHGQPMVAYDTDQPMTGSFSAYLRDITDDSYVTLPEFITRTGLYELSWGTTLTGMGTEVPKLVDLKWTVQGSPEHGDPADHTMLFKYCHLTGAIAEGGPNTITINWTSFDIYPICT